MSNIIKLRDRARVEIHGGVITACIITDAAGTRSDDTDVGHFKYFVDVVEEDGGRICMWDGRDRSEAYIEARECAASWKVPVFDLTTGAA